MEVIDFRGTHKVTDDSDLIKEFYLGNELMWKLKYGVDNPVYLDVVGRDGNKVHLDVVKVSPVYLEGIIKAVKAIDENGGTVEVKEGYIEAGIANMWIKIPKNAIEDVYITLMTDKLGQFRLTPVSTSQPVRLALDLTAPLPETVTKLAIQLEDGTWFGKRA